MAITFKQRRSNASSTALLLLVTLACALFCLIEEQEQFYGPIIDNAPLEERNGLIFNAAATTTEMDEEEEDDTDGGELDRLMYGRRALMNEQEEQETVADEEPSQGGGPLLSTLKDINVDNGDYDAAFAAVFNSEPPTSQGNKLTPLPSIQPYTFQDAMAESSMFETTFAVLVYSPQDDKFVGLYDKTAHWTASNRKLLATLNNVSYLLRSQFPERFTPDMPELALAIGSGDYPHIKLKKLPKHRGVAPVFEFGSGFLDTNEIFPNMITMPMPERHHLLCFEEWVKFGTVCTQLKAADEKGGNGELVFGEEKGLEWDKLIPQLIWRGSDFGYLPSLTRPRPIKPHAFKVGKGEQNTKDAAIRALRENYERLLPRWKGVVITAESEQEAEKDGRELPWANIKFSGGTKKTHREPEHYYLDDSKVRNLRGWEKHAEQDEQLITYDETGIATGKYTSLHELANYKYHIDLAGGGGTTWTGTFQKLAMPGLLFHHVTPTKDYVHDRLEPWRHYIPVSSDLHDLKSKFEWAEAHPDESKWISEQGTAFMRHFISEEGYGQMFQEDFVEPLRRAIEAYQPVSKTYPDKTWVDILQKYGKRMEPIVECSGLSTRGSCKPMTSSRDGRLNLSSTYNPVIARPASKTSKSVPPRRAAPKIATPTENIEQHEELVGKVGAFSEIVGAKS
ncbi:hypothetical protein ACHAXR_005643 [Thalassiosira sp. AJA248-18]